MPATITTMNLNVKTANRYFEKNYRIGRCTINISKQQKGAPFFRFTITEDDGTAHSFGGLPNMCETFQSAFMRAYHRAKWINDNTYHNHYE